MKQKHHIIDPTFFFDALDMYGTDYDAYFVSSMKLDEHGRQKSEFDKVEISGSLQTQGTRLLQRNEGNVQVNTYKFYCSSQFRLNIGDFIIYNKKLLHIVDSHDYDEYGVSEFSLESTLLNEHQDLKSYVRHLTGDEII